MKPSKFYDTFKHSIIGSTVWGVRKCFGKSYTDTEQFQMVVVDEASQLLSAHCIYPLMHLSKEHGRLVLAGDHYQLPPIISTDYPDEVLICFFINLRTSERLYLKASLRKINIENACICFKKTGV